MRLTHVVFPFPFKDYHAKVLNFYMWLLNNCKEIKIVIFHKWNGLKMKADRVTKKRRKIFTKQIKPEHFWWIYLFISMCRWIIIILSDKLGTQINKNDDMWTCFITMTHCCCRRLFEIEIIQSRSCLWPDYLN